MADNLTTTNSGAVSAEYQQAVSLHRSIMANGQLAADAFVEFCKGLKQMRDHKLYTELGFEEFSDYVEGAVGIKQRQAYSYISTYEKLGQSFLQSNATLGITKLELLATVPALDRDEVTEDNNLDGMSVSEIRELVAKYNEQQEQLSLLGSAQEEKNRIEQERDELLSEVQDLKEQLADLPEQDRNKLLSRISELEVQLNEPVEADPEAVEKIRAEETARAEKEAAAKIKQIEKDTKDKIKAAKDKAKADADAAVKAAEEKASKEVAAAEQRAQEIAKKQLEDSLRDIEQEKDAAVARQRELEQKLKATANPDTALLNFHLKSIQEQFAKASDCLVRIAHTDSETADKFRGAIERLLDSLKEKL